LDKVIALAFCCFYKVIVFVCCFSLRLRLPPVYCVLIFIRIQKANPQQPPVPPAAYGAPVPLAAYAAPVPPVPSVLNCIILRIQQECKQE